MSYTVQVSGLGLLFDDLKELYGHLDDDTEAMRRIAEYGRAVTHEGFEMQGRFSPWEELSTLTLDRRAKEGIESEDILVRVGDTMDSFMGEGSMNTVLVVDNHMARWGNNRVDFIYHDQGSRTEPVRQILGHTEVDINMYHWLYRYFLFERLKNR